MIKLHRWGALLAAVAAAFLALLLLMHLSGVRRVVALGPVESSRAVWMWSAEPVLDAQARREFLDFAGQKGLHSVFVEAESLLLSDPAALRDFVAQTAGVSVTVELLAGNPVWALTPTHAAALDFVSQAVTFTQAITPGQPRPLGVHLDVEPYTLDAWDCCSTTVALQYLALLEKVQQELQNAGGDLYLNVDIPFWFDHYTFTHASVTQPLSRHVQDIADRVTLMDYRDHALGNDGIIAHAADEMLYAASISKTVIIGVETLDVEPPKITFFEEGEAMMEAQLAVVQAHYGAEPAFAGFAIHSYRGYRALATPRVYLPLLLMTSGGL